MKGPLRLVVSLLILLFASPLQTFAQLGTVAGVAASAVALDAVLSHLVNQVSNEVKGILEQAQSEAQALEATFGTDLFNFEGMTVADIENLTGNALNQVDNELQASLADLTRLEDKIDVQVATQIRDSIHLANLTWKNVAKDTEKLVVKFEQGAAVIVDSALIQAVRIITLIGAFVIVVVGVIVLLKARVPGIVVGAVGLVILIFCFTPLFAALVSNWSSASKVIKLDDSEDPPEILITAPSTFKYGDKGNLQILGMNFLPKAGSSSLLVGSSEGDLQPESRASITPATITLPLEVITGKSGTYYIKVHRGDNQETPVLALYTQRPGQIPVHIVYSIWQTGTMSSQSTGYHQTRETQDDHGWGNTTKAYYETYTPPVPWTSTGFSKNEISRNHLSDLTENIAGTSLKINYKLSSGPWWDTWRGWYNADYRITIQRTDYSADTRLMAEHGDKTLYYDEETQQLSATRGSKYSGLGLYSYELKLGGTITPKGVPTPPGARVAPLHQELRAAVTKPADLFLGASAFKILAIRPPANATPLTGTRTSSSYYLRSFRSATATAASTVRPVIPFVTLRQPSQVTFELGQAPRVPGFTPQQTWYDVAVAFGDTSKAFTNKTGQTPVYDSSGNLLMTFHTDAAGKLSMTWLHD